MVPSVTAAERMEPSAPAPESPASRPARVRRGVRERVPGARGSRIRSTSRSGPRLRDRVPRCVPTPALLARNRPHDSHRARAELLAAPGSAGDGLSIRTTPRLPSTRLPAHCRGRILSQRKRRPIASSLPVDVGRGRAEVSTSEHSDVGYRRTQVAGRTSLPASYCMSAPPRTGWTHESHDGRHRTQRVCVPFVATPGSRASRPRSRARPATGNWRSHKWDVHPRHRGGLTQSE